LKNNIKMPKSNSTLDETTPVSLKTQANASPLGKYHHNKYLTKNIIV
jgi:hypothetical protein